MPDPGRTIRQARRDIAGRLAASSDTSNLDAELLLRAVLGLDRTGLFMREPDPMSDEEEMKLEGLVQRRLDGEPMAYILHRAPFRELMLYVDERVLIPRPETEQLVQVALDDLTGRPGPVKIVDVGTGSGAIALALASESMHRADDEIVATDASVDALYVASINRERLGLTGRVRLVQTNLLDELEGSFDLILANLPYLRPDQRHPSTEREPDNALYAGEDGFDLYRQLIAALPERLAAGGLFVAEIDPDQSGIGVESVRQVMSGATAVMRDASGRDRFLVHRRDA